MKINNLLNVDNIDFLKSVKDNTFDLVITSPPYDNLRDYKSDINSDIFSQLYRTVKSGGILCWNVFDQKKEGYTANSMKQALQFIEAGFILHQYLIYEKNSVAFNARKHGSLYTNIFEFVFVFSKGNPKTVNLICDKKNKYAGLGSYDGKVKCVADFSPRTNIWRYATSQNEKSNHPAVMPEKLCADLIKSYSNEKDLVFDPYSGSGTTLIMAHRLNRNYIGCEIDTDYFLESSKRLNVLKSQQSLF